MGSSNNKNDAKLDDNYIYGRWGIYQVIQAALIFYNILPTAFQLLMGVFIGYRPTFQCSSSSTFENNTLNSNSSYFITFEKCQTKVLYNDTAKGTISLVRETTCSEGYRYNLEKDRSYVTEVFDTVPSRPVGGYTIGNSDSTLLSMRGQCSNNSNICMDLVCDRAYLGELVQTLIMTGQLVGAAFASSLSDRYGRKTVHLTSHLLTLAFGVGVAFSPNYVTLAALKFVLGILQQVIGVNTLECIASPLCIMLSLRSRRSRSDHRSSAVRIYKQASEEKERKISDSLQPPTLKTQCTVESERAPPTATSSALTADTTKKHNSWSLNHGAWTWCVPSDLVAEKIYCLRCETCTRCLFKCCWLFKGMVMSNAVLGLELFPEQTRFYSEAIGLFCWTTGLVIMAPIAYLMRNYSWRYLQIALTSFSLISLVQYWAQDESLRWLVANGKEEAVEKVVRKVARWNKINYEDLKQIVEKKMASIKHNTQKPDETETATNSALSSVVEKYSPLTILKNRRILIISLIIWFTWVTNTVTYFGLTLTSTSLAGNRFLNFFLSSIVEYIAVICEFLMLRRLGRRTILIIFHAVCGGSLASATLLNNLSDGNSRMQMASVATTFVGKSAISGSFSTLFLFTPELYPTNLRNVGIGFSSAFSRLGSIISPFAGTLAEEFPWAPGTIFSVMCFMVMVIILFVPETRGVELPQTLVEVNQWYSENSGLRQRK